MRYDRQILPVREYRRQQKTQFAFVLCKGFCLMDLGTAISVLNAANRVLGEKRFDWVIASVDGQPVTCTNGVPYPVEVGCDEIDMNARAFVFAYSNIAQDADPALLAWLRKMARSGSEMGAFGTGASLLVRAGILGRRRFTLHWSAHTVVSELFPEHTPTRSLYEVDDRFFTCAGAQSSSDMLIELLSRDISPTFGVQVADYLLGPAPRACDTPQRQSTANRFGTRNPLFLTIIDEIDANETGELTLNDILARHPISRRQLERLFNQFCGESPARYLKNQRLERGRKLLDQTSMSIMDISVAVGFQSVANFSSSFSQRYGCRPTNYRMVAAE